MGALAGKGTSVVETCVGAWIVAQMAGVGGARATHPLLRPIGGGFRANVDERLAG